MPSPYQTPNLLANNSTPLPVAENTQGFDLARYRYLVNNAISNAYTGPGTTMVPRHLGSSGWNPGPSVLGSTFMGPSGFVPTGVNYTGTPTAYNTTWTSTPGINGGAIPRAQLANDPGRGANQSGFGNAPVMTNSVMTGGGWNPHLMAALRQQ